MFSHADRPIETTATTAQPPLIFMASGASPEWRLNMAVLLQAVFEQDETLVQSDCGIGRKEANKQQLAKEAREYVASGEFTEMCNLVGVDASFMRALTPEKARIAYSKLLDQQLSGLKVSNAE